MFPPLTVVLATIWASETVAEPVDLELVLAADVSDSMSGDVARMQRLAYAEALESPEIAIALSLGTYRAFVLTYVEWGDVGLERIVLPWTRISTAETAQAVARQLRDATIPHLTKTSISHTIDFASGLFEDNDFEGSRLVIDVSGNGPNNQGDKVDVARDRAVASGVTINGLPILTDLAMPRGVFDTGFDLRQLDQYYAACVTGGPGAFTLPVRTAADLATALKAKLVLEISGMDDPDAPRVIRVADRSLARIDC